MPERTYLGWWRGSAIVGILIACGGAWLVGEEFFKDVSGRPGFLSPVGVVMGSVAMVLGVIVAVPALILDHRARSGHARPHRTNKADGGTQE